MAKSSRPAKRKKKEDSMPGVTITFRNGKLDVDQPYLKIGVDEQVTWTLDTDDSDCVVEILFALGYGYHGPFGILSPGWHPENPTRGWYILGSGQQSVASNPVTRRDLVGSVWKYDVVVHDRASGVTILTHDPYIKIS
jgi:hypothetical protein